MKIENLIPNLDNHRIYVQGFDLSIMCELQLFSTQTRHHFFVLKFWGKHKKKMNRGSDGKK